MSLGVHAGALGLDQLLNEPVVRAETARVDSLACKGRCPASLFPRGVYPRHHPRPAPTAPTPSLGELGVARDMGAGAAHPQGAQETRTPPLKAPGHPPAFSATVEIFQLNHKRRLRQVPPRPAFPTTSPDGPGLLARAAHRHSAWALYPLWHRACTAQLPALPIEPGFPRPHPGPVLQQVPGNQPPFPTQSRKINPVARR